MIKEKPLLAIVGNSTSDFDVKRAKLLAMSGRFKVIFVDADDNNATIIPIRRFHPRYFFKSLHWLNRLIRIVHNVFVLFCERPKIVLFIYLGKSNALISLLSPGKHAVCLVGSDILQDQGSPRFGFSYLILRRALRDAALVFGVSSHICEQALQVATNKLKSPPIKLLFGVDCNKYHQTNNDAPKCVRKIIIYNPRPSHPIYNIVQFISAAEILLETHKSRDIEIYYRPATYLLAQNNNDLAYQSSVKSLVQNSLNSNKFIALGSMSEKERLRAYRQSNIVVSISHSDGFPVSILEAMSMGKIVVVGDIPGVRDVINHGINGFLVDKDNPHAIVDQLSFIIEKYDKLQPAIGRQARDTVLAIGNVETEIETYIKHFESVVNT